MGVKLSILIPQYNEDETVISPLLDSLLIQQGVDLKEVEIIIVNDKSDVILSDSFIDKYANKFAKVEYIKSEKHIGVSAARNMALDAASGDYVMFCDADDMFLNACGLYIIFTEMEEGGFDSFMSCFTEETRHPETGERLYVNHDTDSTFVHGKVHRRKYLLDNDIRFNPNLTIHEDSYFNCLCQRLTEKVKYCPMPFYLWKWRDNSVCRHDEKYILKTYNNMLESNTALVNEFITRHKSQEAAFFATSMIYDAYYTMNKKEWLDQANQSYRYNTEKRFKRYYEEFNILFRSIDEQTKQQIIVGIKNRFFGEGLFLESITFDDWIDNILKLK